MTYPIPKPKVRVFTWIILAINVLMLVLLIKYIADVAGSKDSCGTLSRDSCDAAKGIGGTIGSGLLIGLWVALDVILGVLWLVTRKRQPQVIYLNQAAPSPPLSVAPAAPLPSYSAAPASVRDAPAVVRSQPIHAPLQPLSSGKRPGPAPSPAMATSGGLHRGTGPGSVDVVLTKDQQMTFTCGGTWGRTVLAADGQVLVDVTGAQTSYRVVRATGGNVHFDVDTDGTWTIYLRKATRGEAKAS